MNEADRILHLTWDRTSPASDNQLVYQIGRGGLAGFFGVYV